MKLFLRIPFVVLLIIIEMHSINYIWFVQAEEMGIEIFNITQMDLDSDGIPELTIFDCSFVSPNDRIYVYDGNEDMKTGKRWMEITDFVNDIWVFDAFGDGSAQIIIIFSKEEKSSVAYIYDDHNGDSIVDYNFSGGKLIVTEAEYWKLKVEAYETWFLSDGFPNQNLRFLIDGQLGGEETDITSAESLVLDGKIDYEIEIVDNNNDGIAEYFHRIRRAESSRNISLPRNTEGIRVNEGTKRPTFEGYIFWPFLGVPERNPGRNYFDTIPNIDIDWKRAHLMAVGLSGYPIESGYSISNHFLWDKYQFNKANFENPMAYYDLANDLDGWPELHIRLEYFGSNDPYLDIGDSNFPLNDIRYSWNLRNTEGLIWDYKLGLAGRNPIEETVWFGDFGVQTVPYNRLPYWVSDRSWDWGTLVVFEGGSLNTPSSEGLYDWPATNQVWADRTDRRTIIPGSQLALRGYLVGKSEAPLPDIFYQQIRHGFRGEFGYLDDRPNLYFSPVDSRLHLRKAKQGVWNIGDGREVRYANLDGDAYLDTWRYIEHGELKQQLIWRPRQLLYAGEDRVILKQVDVPPSLFETLPPRDHQEWLELGRQLEDHRRDFAPGDLLAMLEQFEGLSFEVEGAGIQDFRLEDEGFRFVLSLEPGFRILNDPEGLASQLPGPGDFVVTYDGNGYSAAELTPPALQAVELRAEGEAGEVKVLKWAGLKGAVENAGREDVSNVHLCALLSGPQGQQERLEATLPLVPGEGRARFAWSWLPPAAGRWQARLEAGCREVRGVELPAQALGTFEIQVGRSSGLLPEFFLLGGETRPEISLFILGAGLLSACATAVFFSNAYRKRPGS